MYTLNCSVSKTIGGLMNSPTASWTTERMTAFDDSGVVITQNSDGLLTSILTFTLLRTSHGGMYYCNSNLTSPALEIPLQGFTLENVYVQSKPNKELKW